MNIILIGFMGTGKTSVGKLLAHKIKKKFIDIDDEIEKNEKLSISDIFNKHGESYFRDKENFYLKKNLENDNYIIAAGGGIVVNKKNIPLLKKGLVILLTANPDIIYERIKNEIHRPLLNVPDPLKKINELLSKRKPLYEKSADMIIDTTNLKPEEIIEKIEFLIKTLITYKTLT